uniref:Chemokine ligand 39 n=1 Tax=Ctenopharyngodon idella TaxID=7959 RepID=A0A345D724_CTEID|nr:chemokine ligand 39 [Ctenopharyngodon idella]
MRSLMFLLVLVLFCSLQMTSSHTTSAIDAANSKCCMKFSKVKIPVRLVKSYSWTRSDCPRQAIVFHMISGKEICVDPEASWVSRHVAKVDKRTTSATAKTQSPTV